MDINRKKVFVKVGNNKINYEICGLFILKLC